MVNWRDIYTTNLTKIQNIIDNKIIGRYNFRKLKVKYK